jgi:hypothetical protein
MKEFSKKLTDFHVQQNNLVQQLTTQKSNCNGSVNMKGQNKARHMTKFLLPKLDLQVNLEWLTSSI